MTEPELDPWPGRRLDAVLLLPRTSRTCWLMAVNTSPTLPSASTGADTTCSLAEEGDPEGGSEGVRGGQRGSEGVRG
eukprot:166967-Prorocentrum_minimum.AAC.1